MVNGEQFAVYLERMEKKVLVRVYNTNNGGSLGDAYGRFVDGSAYTASQHFKPGDWIIFSNNLATTIAEFTLETGTT